HFSGEAREPEIGSVEPEIGRRTGRRFCYLETASDKHALETLGPARGIPEQENAMTKQVRHGITRAQRAGPSYSSAHARASTPRVGDARRPHPDGHAPARGPGNPGSAGTGRDAVGA